MLKIQPIEIFETLKKMSEPWVTGAKIVKLFCGYLFDYYWTTGLAKQRVLLTEEGGP